MAIRPKRQARRFITGNEINGSEPIAIIGMSGRFPKARTIDEFWEVLVQGKDAVEEIPAERFDWRQYYGDPLKEEGKTNCKWCGCIAGVKEFEPLFFEISPREAECIDPKQRLLLQESWRALEDAGYGSEQLKSQKIGMFVGVERGDYQDLTNWEGGVTSNSNAILAARLSYFLNLNGPVLAIDTACSSGLVAAHQAVLSLRAGECDAAIAAGVHLLLTPGPLIGMGQTGMLSPEGKCRSFDKGADGMVPGEAVVAVVLKRLSRAEADGDPIYAVIKGSGINYDGKTNGITAPNGIAQTALLKTVYDQYRINPEMIEYIVTHGTGTKLGDPIEINALYDAFKGYTSRDGARKQGYCALTSTKSNIGHTMAASGLVSLVCLVQALRHETIPASLHCEQENDYINWQESPFYVNKANKAWPRSALQRWLRHLWGDRVRTGAVSAFGMSGTNVHMVVESYEGTGTHPETAPYYLLAFSAKTEAALTEKIQDMIALLEDRSKPAPVYARDLAAISYTLLEGRQHFNHRCAVVAQDRENAVYILKQTGGSEKLPNLFRGKVGRGFTGQKAIEQYARELLDQSRGFKTDKAKYQEMLFALADLYCQGYQLKWGELFGTGNRQRIHLPTYPFAREEYWLSGKGTDAGKMGVAALHPLLHQNTSDLSEQRFSTTFTGQEFFLADHVIKGQRELPGVVYLEMARAAVERKRTDAAGETLVEGQGIRLKNVVWMRPLVVGEEPFSINIGLYPEADGEIAYEIYSATGEAGAETVYSRGSGAITSVSEAPIVELSAWQGKNGQILDSSQLYRMYQETGREYGPGHRGVETVYKGQGWILAKLVLPSSVRDTKDQYVLHPSIMDSAFQALIGFQNEGQGRGDGQGSKPFLPFALEELEIYSGCTAVMWALIREKSKTGDRLPKYDIDICEETGKVCVRMKGYASRVLEGELVAAGAVTTRGTLMLAPIWKEETVTQGEAADYGRRLVIIGELNEADPEAIQAQIPGARCVSLQSKQKGIDKRFQAYAGQVFEVVQSIIRDKPKAKVLIQIMVSSQREGRMLAGLTGLLKTAQHGEPQIGWTTT